MLSTRRGFTLVEALLASSILAMAILALTLPFTAAAQNQRADGQITFAAALAQELVDEILTKPFYDPQGGGLTPGPEPGESGRNLFDNIDDYHGYSESDGNVTNAAGEVCTDALATGLSRSATAEYVRVAGQSDTDPPTFISVTVTVNYHSDPVVSLSRLVYAME